MKFLKKFIFLGIFFLLEIHLLNPTMGFCNDLDDNIEIDNTISQESTIGKKDPNISYLKRKTLSAAENESRKAEKEADEYTTYTFKGPLGYERKIKMKDDTKNEKTTGGNGGKEQIVGGVIVKPGAKCKDINVYVETNGPVINVNK